MRRAAWMRLKRLVIPRPPGLTAMIEDRATDMVCDQAFPIVRYDKDAIEKVMSDSDVPAQPRLAARCAQRPARLQGRGGRPPLGHARLPHSAEARHAPCGVDAAEEAVPAEEYVREVDTQTTREVHFVRGRRYYYDFMIRHFDRDTVVEPMPVVPAREMATQTVLEDTGTDKVGEHEAAQVEKYVQTFPGDLEEHWRPISSREWRCGGTSFEKRVEVLFSKRLADIVYDYVLEPAREGRCVEWKRSMGDLGNMADELLDCWNELGAMGVDDTDAVVWIVDPDTKETIDVKWDPDSDEEEEMRGEG